MAISARWATGSTPARRSAATCSTVLEQIRRRADSSRQSGWRRSSPKRRRTCSSSIPTGSSRTRTARRCAPTASRSAAGGAVRGTRSTARIPKCRSISSRCSGRCASEWGCTYFKLDANFWGAMHGGRFHDPRATRVEAYRRGMEAIRRGAGDSFLLGCNHPIWPSAGLIHGSRSSNDIKRTWDRVDDDGAAEPEPQLAERPLVVERSRTPWCWPAS